MAELLGLDYNLVRNWTSGRPFDIKPSVRTARKKGAANLFGVNDVYRLAIAAYLLVSSNFQVVREVLPKVREEWFDKSERGRLFAYRANSSADEISVEHIPQSKPASAAIKDYNLLDSQWHSSIDLKRLLDEFDMKIEERERKMSQHKRKRGIRAIA